MKLLSANFETLWDTNVCIAKDRVGDAYPFGTSDRTSNIRIIKSTFDTGSVVVVPVWIICSVVLIINPSVPIAELAVSLSMIVLE